MFEIGFMELVLIAIVSLIVVGPERLPGAIRTATLWIGRAKRSFNQVKTEIEREINADEIRRQLHNESILADLDKAKKKADTFVQETRRNIDNLNTEVNATLKEEARVKPPAILPPQVNQSPADPVDDPARFDEDYVAPEQSVASSAPEPEPAPVAKAEPVEDFYNNPPAGTIRLKGGAYSSVSPKTDEQKDQQRQE